RRLVDDRNRRRHPQRRRDGGVDAAPPRLVRSRSDARPPRRRQGRALPGHAPGGVSPGSPRRLAVAAPHPATRPAPPAPAPLGGDGVRPPSARDRTPYTRRPRDDARKTTT